MSYLAVICQKHLVVFQQGHHLFSGAQVESEVRHRLHQKELAQHSKWGVATSSLTIPVSKRLLIKPTHPSIPTTEMDGEKTHPSMGLLCKMGRGSPFCLLFGRKAPLGKDDNI